MQKISKKVQKRNKRDHNKGKSINSANKEYKNKQNTRMKTCDLFGVHAVTEAVLNPRRHIHDIFVTTQGQKLLHGVLKKSDAAGLQRPELKLVEKYILEEMLPEGAVHQGVALCAQDLHVPALDAFCGELEKNSVISDNIFVVLDQVTDPHNIGAILRSASVLGAKAMIVQQRHTPEMKGTLGKVACGALEHVPVFRETNLSRALELLQKHDILCLGLDERGKMQLSDVMADKNLSSYSGVALVLGAEGDGMRRLTAEHCDVLVSLPASGAIKSLNVSNAAAVALYELVR